MTTALHPNHTTTKDHTAAVASVVPTRSSAQNNTEEHTMSGTNTVTNSSNSSNSNPESSPEAGLASTTTDNMPPPTTSPPLADSTSSTANTTSTTNINNNMMFPCIEQPLRITLFCSNGYYLWGGRNNRALARSRRSEKDEFIVKYTDRDHGIVELVNHKFGGYLSVIVNNDTTTNENENGITKENQVMCIPQPKKQSSSSSSAPPSAPSSNGDDVTVDPPNGDKDDDDNNNNGNNEVFVDEPEPSSTTTTTNELDRQWCFVRVARSSGQENGSNHGGGGGTQVVLKSLRTSENLGVDSKGNLVLVPDVSIMDPSTSTASSINPVSTTWDIDCVTGELVFISNGNPLLRGGRNDTPKSGSTTTTNGQGQGHASQIRCDMAGLVSLTDAWKGWEVFRIMEASHGYVKISSWMHSQWLLCSTANGTVTTCTHAASLQEHISSKNTKGTCCQWAIERFIPNRNKNNNKEEEQKDEEEDKDDDDNNPMTSNTGLNGVILRSKTYGRLLCIDQDGGLRTYSETEEDDDDEIPTNDDTTALESEIPFPTPPTPTNTTNNNISTMNVTNWWNKNLKSMNTSLKTIQRRMNNNDINNNDPQEEEDIMKKISTKATIVWQLEAAHLQTYYFATAPPPTTTTNSAMEEESNSNATTTTTTTRTIGPIPYVTPNLRQTDKLQLKRKNLPTSGGSGAGDDGTLQLYDTERQQYLSCSAEGIISLVDDDDTITNPDTEWIMDKPRYQGGGNIFRSKLHNLYLSYEVQQQEQQQHVVGAGGELDGPNREQTTSPETATTTTMTASHSERFQQLFSKKQPEPIATLIGSTTIDENSIWKLEPCMPRAVSSEKIATFAIGTSIAVGTTIAMPFALAGAGAILGAVGAEAGVLFQAIAVGLTGAEALASVGAIGATAYIVFRPDENSLTDDHKKDDDDDEAAMERAWSKRPFSNWRNW